MTKRVRRQPQRTCIACRRTTGKRELVRLVRTPEGEILPDATGKKPGRGAYLCPRQACWLKALADGRIGRALKAELSAADRARIQAYAAELEADADCSDASLAESEAVSEALDAAQTPAADRDGQGMNDDQ
jgi:uncharacterized protein